MAILNKEQLFGKVVDAIQECGWDIISQSDVGQQPTRIEVTKADASEILRIYIWNLSHGGGSRAENEYRIQVKVDRFENESNSKTLILGYFDDGGVFAGFDVSKHIGKPGWSASMQIKKEYLDDAGANGISAYAKDNGEIAIAFRPDFFMRYVQDIYELHITGNLNKYLFAEKDINAEIDDDAENEVINFRFSISSYGADYPVDAIVKRIENDVIFVPPFQRRFVWNIKEASRFIESLILGLPVPGIFLSKEDETNRLLIVDGQQRLFSLYSFYKNNFKNKSFKLQGVQSDLEGKTYDDLSSSDKIRLDDSIIHATVVKQDEPDNSDNSVYLIFERLNSSGRLLTPQEVRASIYYGSFNEYLNKIILEKNWRDIFGKMNERMKEQELILRFFSLYFDGTQYEKPLKAFLNKFMRTNRNNERFSESDLDSIIKPSLGVIHSALGKSAFRIGAGVNAAIFDSVMIGVAKRLEKGPINKLEVFKEKYFDLLKNADYLILTKEGTSDDATVSRRIQLAIDKFNSLE